MNLVEALKSTAAAAIAERKASREASREKRWMAYYESAERKELDAAKEVTIGRLTVIASIAGNSRREHVRHTFKIDGKRASRAQVEEQF